MIARKVAPALAVGCTFVARPAKETPLSALAMALLAERAGVPAGVFSVITNSRASIIGKEFCDNPIVRKLTFTGSTEVGRILMEQAAGQIMKTSMELGGNAPFIVFDDADLDKAVEGAMISKYRNNGQTCVCANRIYVQAAVYDAFAEKLAAAVAAMNIGDGLDDGVTVGPLISMDAVEKVEEHIADATAKGAKIMAGGNRHSLGGTFFEPTILTGVTSDMMVTNDETFGPVAPLFKFDTEEEVVAAANDTIFGPRLLLLLQRSVPRSPRARGAGIRHGWREHWAHLHRSGPVWRHQTIRHRPRRLVPRHRGLSGNEIHLYFHLIQHL